MSSPSVCSSCGAPLPADGTLAEVCAACAFALALERSVSENSTVANERINPEPTEPVPSRIGRYAILRVLGHGGMGTVYEARQEQPERTVALKVIRAGCLSPEMLRRFEFESQVLGRLQHPGIAQVYEAGTVQDERGQPQPFFAMEFINGMPVTEYVAKKNLGVRERLDLVARICDAVYHAHQKGVIHRDLKPSNILVDEAGQSKILDFGVARATDSDTQQTTMRTEIGQIVGTVPYMSPEQVSGDPDELDTRSDVYALGVMAYELLAGRLPFDLQRKMIHEAVRVIREEEPTRLSVIDRALRGDVETIVAKALEKDRTRRYQSAEALASDIRRYLKHEPIAARPASTWYQAARFARRNRGLVFGLATAFVLLVAGLIATSISRHQAIVARDSEREAKNAEASARRRAEAVNAFIEKALLTSDPNFTGTAGTQQMLVVDAMMQAAKEIDAGAFKDDPGSEASVLYAIGTVLQGNGRPEEGLRMLTRSLALWERVRPGDHPDVGRALNNLGLTFARLGRFEEFEAYSQRSLDMDRRIYKGDRPEIALKLENVASARLALGRAAEAEPLLQEALEMNRRLFKGDNARLANCLGVLAGVRQSLGHVAEAEPLAQQSLEMWQRVSGGDSPEVANALGNLAGLRVRLGRTAEAEPLQVQALDMYRRLFKGDHPATAGALNNLGSGLWALGRFADAEPLHMEAIAMARRVFAGDHPNVATFMRNLARCRAALGRLPEALTLAQDAAALAARTLPEGHPERVKCDEMLAEIKSKL